MPHKLPRELLDSLNGINGFDEEAFIDIHESGEQVTSIRFNPNKLQYCTAHMDRDQKIPWCTNGYYLSERPSFILDPLLHAGLYYVQEPSGMFLEQAIRQTLDISIPVKVLDLCAAPGGKATLIHSIISEESLLVCNEVIKTRASILEENLIKWGVENVIITNSDPRELGRLENFFDLVVIDAPCSGSGLFRKDPASIDEWNLENVNHCNLRQKRIIADVYNCLNQSGILIYSTCSFSEEENEDIMDWIKGEFAMDSVPLSVPGEWGIVEVTSNKFRQSGYRFFPHRVKGEGFFISCFRKNDGEKAHNIYQKKQRLEKVNKPVENSIYRMLKSNVDPFFFRRGDTIIGFPAKLTADLQVIISGLYIRYAGVLLGKVSGDDLIPSHSFAVSNWISREIVSIPLKKDQALQYLRRDEVMISTNFKGWCSVRYEGLNLGWVKVLSNRLNNYYPKEWRILKSIS